MFALKHVTDYCTLLDFAEPYYYYYYYLLRPKAAQQNITITKTEETHKKLRTKIHKN